MSDRVGDGSEGSEIGRILECLMKEMSVKRNGSSLREGHGVESRECEDVSLSFRRGGGGVEED